MYCYKKSVPKKYVNCIIMLCSAHILNSTFFTFCCCQKFFSIVDVNIYFLKSLYTSNFLFIHFYPSNSLYSSLVNLIISSAQLKCQYYYYLSNSELYIGHFPFCFSYCFIRYKQKYNDSKYICATL